MSSEEIKKSILQLIEKLNEPDYICFGRKENIDKIKECLPKNVKPCIMPDNYFPEETQNKIYIIPCKEREVSIRWG